MKFILDTNVVSEMTKPNPDTNALNWFNSCPENKMYISSLTLGEIEAGIRYLIPGKRQNHLMLWLEELQSNFKPRILSVDITIALRWGEIRGNLRRSGINIPIIDGILAATAITNNAVLVTRNTKDFNFPGIELLNPWL